ncbi:carbamoyl-phosphate synthase large subunit [Natranaerovirga hydrolytica]|uniref:Carbamoyl phosphate synthase large chain n=1 Tax=Natranaerovirga hydrolytica TaxID=680378 RepID=A0A4R1MK39_9FIRM|nr:carbamoyl-phosphate synthase large subunit [Natranaerovirga hydrolytica]TCK92380.1 carbamoyl-phosphate synthase large subunit [Natranaerovirga hydrolytica]
MPRDTRIKKVLVLGSGPIIIGQAAEFDYSGTQACQALKEEGIETVLLNSNPATIMTDKEVADKVYIEPLTVEFAEKIIAKERPDSILAGVGGQTGLNLAVELHDNKILEKYNVKVIGTPIAAIKEGEDRDDFKRLMERINQPTPPSKIVTTMEDGVDFAQSIGYPVVVRPAYTLGGTGGGIADDKEELKEILAQGLQLSRVGQVLLEKSIKGWKEIEYEVIRDSAGNCITVCNMENIDPVGVHTGDSIVVAPSQTLSDIEYQMLRKASIDIINAVGIEGGCNVQLALNPDNFDYAVIEINPRVSRSSALASKATGYPIAKVSTKIALGYNLDEIENDVTKKTKACFEPTLDYCVIKIPKWPFDKFRRAKKVLGTKMMATGEVMAIGNNFEAALLKAVRSLEIGQYSLYHKKAATRSLEELKRRVQIPDDERLFDLAEMLRRFYRVDKVCKITGMDPFFVNKIKKIVDEEEKLRQIGFENLDKEWLKTLKVKGFSDKGIADFIGCSSEDIYNKRKEYGILPVYKMVDTCGGEFEAISPYYYSTYDIYDEVEVSDRRKIMVLGSGPIRIGQGIEFDYCSVHSILALRKKGIETIIVNNNPETVSTDFDIADKLYFEPLTEEDTLNIIEKEKPEGVVLQFGGQTAIKLANFLREKGIKILGTSPVDIDAAEDREKFDALLEKFDVDRPKGVGVWSLEEGLEKGDEIGYPALVRPSYVLGGQGMEITYNKQELEQYLVQAFEKEDNQSVLIDKYLTGKEIEVDAICDGEDILIPGIMEHLEKAGVHSGDSISIYPPRNITQEIKDKILEVTKKMAVALNVIGMINIQFIEAEGKLYIIEVNPRSSRTVPYISKVTGVPIIDLATSVMLGEKLKDLGYGKGLYPEKENYAIKVPVFSTQKLPDVEVSLGPEMKSTGEVLGIGKTFEEALYKGFVGAGIPMPKKNGTILVTIKPEDQERFAKLAKELDQLDYQFVATEGTAKRLEASGLKVKQVKKINEGVPNILDLVRSGMVDIVINTPTKANDARRDGFMIRRAAIESSVPVLTSLDTAEGLLDTLKAKLDESTLDVYDIANNI